MSGLTVAFIAAMMQIAAQLSGLPSPPPPQIVFDKALPQFGAYTYPGVVHLRPDWNADSIMDQAIFIHELVHVSQFAAGIHYRCEAEMERLAYSVQAVFLAQHGVDFWQQHPPVWLEDFLTQALDEGVNVVLGELQYGRRPFVWENFSPHVKFVGLRASSPAWAKESIINELIRRTPEARHICWSDADVFWEKPGWGGEIVEALQLYKIIQPWSQAIDRGPHGEVLSTFRSFCYQYEQGAPLVPDRHGWKTYGHAYPHPGFCWASTREVLDHTGGLFDLSGMGSADHVMALALIGKARAAAPPHMNERYIEHLLRWEERIRHAVIGRIGYVPAVINHRFHGKKADRKYLERWQSFLKHGFDPDLHLKRNLHGILEWSGKSATLEREWLVYLRSRHEDGNESE